MSRWGVTKNLIKRNRDKINKQLRIDLESKISSITSHVDTQKKYLVDWKDIDSYVKTTFPCANVSNIPIYIVSSEVMDNNGFRGCGGCYISDLQLILVKNKIHVSSDGKGSFDKYVNSIISHEVSVDDVVIHEVLHAVSDKTNRVATARCRWYEGIGNKYTVAEEEFVYTNCIPYYRSKGMTDDLIVDSIFLPFCFADVLRDKVFLVKLLKNLDIHQINENVLDEYADRLAMPIISEARCRASRMINLYQKYVLGDKNPNVICDEDKWDYFGDIEDF